MNKLVSFVPVALAMVVFVFGHPAWAVDMADGGKPSGGYCSDCHSGIGNVINPDQTLEKDAPKRHGMYALAEVRTQLKNGKIPMSAFKNTVSPDRIEKVAAYVLAQADKGQHSSEALPQTDEG